MYVSVRLPRQWSKLSCMCRYSSASEEGKHIKSNVSPPVKIKRSPTDILQALASTVGSDPTAAHYKYHDDPYLTPQSNFQKRSYALSQEAGRKAAAWIRDEHAELFRLRTWDPPMKMQTPHFNADPKIPAFAPKPFYNEADKVTEEDLTFLIGNAQVEDSMRVYSLLEGKISEDIKRSLLELISYSNEKELASEEWAEERWYSQGVGRQRRIATWKVGGMAEELFNSLENKDSNAYCAIISGMAKYSYAERAYQLSREALDSGHKLNVQVYHNLINVVGFLREGAVQRIDYLKQLLQEIKDQGLSPTAQTLSSCLSAVSGWGGSPAVREIALKLLAEFKEIGIGPNLSAYYALLCIFCKENGPRTDILSSILNELEKKDKLSASDPKDIYFFVTAMAVCCEHLQDVDLAERVHNLLLKGNYKLLGDSYKESIYYRNYITLHCKNSTPEKVCELLDELVPNVYIPEPSVMEEIIKSLELGGFGDRLAQAWSQMAMFGLARRTSLVERLLAAMVGCYNLHESDVQERMRKAAAAILEYSDNLQESKDLYTPPPKMSATALASIAQLCGAAEPSGADDPVWSAAERALDQLRKGEAAGIPSQHESLIEFAKNAAKFGKISAAATALQYLSEQGLPGTSEACVATLETMLARTEKEVLELLESPPENAEQSLLNIVRAYQMSKSTEFVDGKSYSRKNSNTSSSGSDSSDSDDERR